jgi:hypothetical protein
VYGLPGSTSHSVDVIEDVRLEALLVCSCHVEKNVPESNNECTVELSFLRRSAGYILSPSNQAALMFAWIHKHETSARIASSTW